MADPAAGSSAARPGSSGAPDFHIGYLYSSPLIMRNIGEYLEVEQLNLREEFKAFKRAIADSKRKVHITRKVATVENMANILANNLQVLHYTGHGLKGGLAFEDRCGQMHTIENKALGEIFSAAEGSKVQVVFVAACHSEIAGRAFAIAGVPHVIAIKVDDKVEDKSAGKFMRQFYHKLMMGQTVQGAFEMAKKVVQYGPGATAESEARKFLLLGNGNHKLPISERLPEGNLVDNTPRLPFANLPSHDPDHFLGRNVLMYNVIDNFVGKDVRLLTLTGERKIGKSSVGVAAARFMQDRHMFKDGVLYVSFNGETGMSEEDIAGRIFATIERCKTYPELREIKAQAQNFVNALILLLRDKEAMLVLDNLDGLVEKGAQKQPIVKFLFNLMSNTESLRVLATCVSTIGVTDYIVEKPLVVKGLQPDKVARLFHKLTRDKLDGKVHVGIVGLFGPKQLYDKLSEHKLVTAVINGSPALCLDTARRFNSNPRKLDEIVQEMEREMQQDAKAPSDGSGGDGSGDSGSGGRGGSGDPSCDNFEVFWRGFDRGVLWPQFKERLDEYFKRHLGTEVGLSQEDLARACQDAQMLARHHRLRLSSDGILKRAAEIWFRHWYLKIAKTIQQNLSLWERNLLLGPSTSRGYIQQRLTGAAGSFMLRMSANNPGCIAIGFIDRQGQPPEWTLVEKNRREEFVIRFKDTKEIRTFAKFRDLVLECKSLITIYPTEKSKEEEFGDPDDARDAEEGPT